MHDRSSSPDPLNDTYQTPNFHNQLRPKQTPSKSSSKKRKIFQLDVGNEISPQKIRVTVEAGETRNNGVKRISCSPIRSTSKQKPKTTAGIIESSKPSESSNYRGINATPKRGIGRPRKSLSASVNKKEATVSKNKSSSGLSSDLVDLDPYESSLSKLTLSAQLTRKESKRSRSSSRKLKRTPQAELFPTDILESHNPLTEVADEIRIERSQYIYPKGADKQHHDHLGISSDQTGIIHGEDNKIENTINTRPEINGSSYVKTNSSNNLNISPRSNNVENDSRRFVRPRSHKENYYLSKSKSEGGNYPSPESLENQISPESRRIPARACRALMDQDIILSSGYQDDESWIAHNKISELQQQGSITESEESNMNSGDSIQSLNHVRDSIANHISRPKVKIPMNQVYNQRKPFTSPQEITGARKYAGNDSGAQDFSLKEFDNFYEREIEDEEEDFDLLLETLNSPSSIRSKYPEMHEEIVQQSREPKSFGPGDDNRKEAHRKKSGPVSSDTKIMHPELDDNKNESTLEPVATIEQEEDCNLQSGELHICQIPQKLNFDPNTRKNNASNLSFQYKNPIPKSSLRLSQNSLQPDLKQLATNDPIHDMSSNKKKSDYLNISGGSDELTPIQQKAGLSPQSEFVLSSPQIPSSSISGPPQPSEISSSSTTNTSIKINQTPNTNTINSPSHNTKKIPSLQTISYDRGKPSSNDYVFAWAKSLDHSLSPRQNAPSKKTPPNSPTKSCLRSPQKASTCPGPLGTPIKAVSFVSTPPIPSSPLCDSLSGPIWTKSHWSLLDQIVQSWKPESLTGRKINLELEHSRNTTRVISQLLGKYVISDKGERMKLEQWHLDAVDEFRGLIPGWEEKTISMRVFALLIGERIRSEERVTKIRS